MARTLIAAEAFHPEGDMRRAVQRQVLAGLWSAATRPIKRLTASLAERRRINRDVAELAVLSDRMLRDIGVERCDIERIVRHGRDETDVRC